MRHISSYFHGTENLNIHTETWLPSDNPKAVIIIVHGIAEHIGRYAHVASWFVEQGYAVYGYDHRGHGQSDGKRGYFQTFEELVDDLGRFLSLVHTTQSDKKIFLYGHSMGALVALAHILDTSDEGIDALITSGIPLNMDDNVPDFALSFGRILNQVAPDLPITSLDITGMSRDPAVLATWTTDPHVNFNLIRVRTTLGIIGTARHIRANLQDLQLPMLILHGAGDRVVDASASRILYDGISSTDKTLKVYPELYHELINEPERVMVLNDMLGWIELRL